MPKFINSKIWIVLFCCLTKIHCALAPRIMPAKRPFLCELKNSWLNCFHRLLLLLKYFERSRKIFYVKVVPRNIFLQSTVGDKSQNWCPNLQCMNESHLEGRVLNVCLHCTMYIPISKMQHLRFLPGTGSFILLAKYLKKSSTSSIAASKMAFFSSSKMEAFFNRNQ